MLTERENSALPAPADSAAADLRVLSGARPDLSQIAPRQRRLPFPPSFVPTLVFTLDIALAIAFAAAALARFEAPLLAQPFGSVLPFLCVPIVVMLGLACTGARVSAFERQPVAHLLRVAFGAGLGLATLVLCVNAILAPSLVIPVTTLSLALWIALIAQHAHVLILLQWLVRSGRLSENVVLVGATPKAQALIAQNAAMRELNIAGVFDDRLSRSPMKLDGVPVLGRIDDLMSWEHLPRIDKIIVTVSPDARERVRAVIDRLRILPQRVVLLLDFPGLGPDPESLAAIAQSPAAYVSGAPRDWRRAGIKRLSDLALASALLICLSPILAALALAVKLDSPGPVFFRQRRHGFNNEIIRVWKFRSMRDDKNAEFSMSQQTFKDDPRVTRIGRFIRRTSLDELPQLLNVLAGEMSLVGPRPHAIGMTTEAQDVHDIVADYAYRHRVKPGITGWAQIHGSRGPVHTANEVRERIRLDLEYVNRASFLLDLYILLMTAPCLLGDAQRDR